jgi:two-component system NtrC family sensor kinase
VRLPPDGFIGKAIAAHSIAGSFRATSSLDGIERIFAYRRVEPYDAYILYGVSLRAILGTWYRHLIVYGGIFGLAAIALATMSLMATTRMQRERVAVGQWRSAIEDLAAETEQRRIIEAQLFEAEKLETLGQVTGGFAHDFGNVLMAVHLNLESLRGEMKTASHEATLSSAIEEVERGSEAVRSLLIFTRHGTLETQIIDTKSRIQQVTGLLQQAIGAHSVLETMIEPDLWPIEVNANQLELALLNLAVNARDAMPDGGTLSITAKNVHLDGIPRGLTGDFVVISVSDTGCGMSPEILAKAIEPFFTTKEEGRGTGLGLSQVYGFATQGGGTAILESAPGRGTTARIYIPKSDSRYWAGEAGSDATPVRRSA